MKKGILPLQLFLIITVLGSLAFVFMAFQVKPDGFKSEETAKQNVASSKEHLAKIRNNQVTGVISPADLKRLQDEMENMDAPRAVDMNWVQLGPDNFGGRTRVIHFDNQNGETPVVYAGAVSGGLWKSVNLGTTWLKINMDSYNLNVSSMTQTANGDMYVGTGEVFDAHTVSGLSDMGYTSGFMGQGIFKSTDGENFTLLPATKPQFNDLESDWAFVNELANDPNNGRLYAATNNGLKFSNDGGTTWSTAKDADGNELNMNSLDVKVGSDGVVVACINNHCYLSADGNVNGFVNQSNGDSISLPDLGVNRIEFAIAPSDPNIIYASVVNSQGHVYNIYRTDNKGAEWKIVLPGTPSIPIFSDVSGGSYDGFGRGVYHNAITVFPDNPDRLLLGGIDAWQGQKASENGFFDWFTVSESASFPLFPSYVHESHHAYAFVPGSSNSFLVATDGGIFKGEISSGTYSYETGNRNYYTTQFYSVGYSGEKEYAIGGSQSNGTISKPPPGFGNTDQEGFTIFPGVGGPCVVSSIVPEVVVIGTEGGIIRRSDDAGINYSTADQFPGSIGNPDAFRTPMVLVENFDNPNSGDSLWYHATEFIEGGTTITVRSNNAGQPFKYKLPEDMDLNAGDSVIVQDVVTAYYYLGVASGIYFTKEIHRFDKEVEWFTISNSDFGLSGTPYSMTASADGNHLFVGMLDGRLFRISNLATAYNFERADVTSPTCIVATQQIELKVPGSDEEISQVITSIAVDPQNPNNVMITLGNYGNEHYVLHSSNALAQFPEFTSKQGNLPHMPVYSSIIEMRDPDIAILGTEHGIYVTENINASQPQWSPSALNMGSVPVFELKQQLIDKESNTLTLVNGNEVTYVTYFGTNNWGTIYAATYGRGLFYSDEFWTVGLDELSDDNAIINDVLQVYPNPVLTDGYIDFTSGINQNVQLQVFDLSGRIVYSELNSVRKGENRLSLDASKLSQGTYFVRITSGTKQYTGKFLVK